MIDRIARSLLVAALLLPIPVGAARAENIKIAQSSSSANNNTPQPPDYKKGWLAIRSDDTTGVARSLNLQASRKVSWREGMRAVDADATGKLVFVAPPVHGFTLIVGNWIAQPGKKQNVKSVEQHIAKMSNRYEVQAFASDPASDFRYWMLAKHGHVERAFAYAGGTMKLLEVVGPPTSDERFSWSQLSKGWIPCEDDVMTVAGRWSVNPTTLASEPPGYFLGVLGQASK